MVMQGIELSSLCIFIFSAVVFSESEHEGEEIENNALDMPAEFLDYASQDAVDGEYIVEGDILLPKGVNNNDWASGQARSTLNVNFWKNGVIYYKFDPSVDEELKSFIYQGMENWEKPSCLKFKECVDDYTCIDITAAVKSCSSHIGSVPGGQKLYLGQGCKTINIVTHELGHSVGFYHEQARFDRDAHIFVNAHNINPEKHKQFSKQMDDWGTEYDHTSIMHYHSKSFSKDRFSLHSMVSYNPHYQIMMGKSKNLSFRDEYRVNKMYHCSAECPNKNVKCQNGGYLSPYKKDNKPCHCVCPPRISGSQCEHKPNHYEYYNLSPCNLNVTKPSVISTPGYPHRNKPPDKCSYWIQAPEGKTVEVEFKDFSFSPRSNGNRCMYERVEIRHEDFYNGLVYCGEELKGHTLQSTSDHFVIIIDAEERARGRRGLKAKVDFV